MSGQIKYKRKKLNFKINRAMQFRMIGKICLILFVSQVISGLIFYYFSSQEVTASFQLFHIKARNFMDFLWPVVSAAIIVSIAVGFVASLFFPKPFAGALYRIEEDLKKANAGDLSVEIRLRGNDQIQPIADQINQLLILQHQRLSHVQRAIEILNNDSLKDGDKSKVAAKRSLEKSIEGLTSL